MSNSDLRSNFIIDSKGPVPRRSEVGQICANVDKSDKLRRGFTAPDCIATTVQVANASKGSLVCLMASERCWQPERVPDGPSGTQID